MNSETAGSGELQPRQDPKQLSSSLDLFFLARFIPQPCSFHQDEKEDT